MTDDIFGPARLPRRASAALAAVIVTAVAAHAEVRVSGNAAAVRIDATRSNVAEVLSALETPFRLRVKTSTALDRAVTGTFAGSLAQVLSRLLEGQNYFVRWQATEIEVTVVTTPGDRATAVTRPPRSPTVPGPAMSLAEAVRVKSR